MAIVSFTLSGLAAPKPMPIPGAGVAAVPPGFRHTVFYDDFSGVADGSLPSSDKWVVLAGTSYPGGPARWGNNEAQVYTKAAANIAVSDGNLRITPRVASGNWTSARIETAPAHDISCLAGQKLRIESRIRLGAAARATQMGIWPAFWTLGAKYRGNYQNWPEVGEIDIFEMVNGDELAYHVVHCGTPRGGPCDETNGISARSRIAKGQWHTIGVEIDRTNPGSDWREETLTWSVDGNNTMVLKGSRVGDKNAWTSLAHASRFLILNVAVGGSFPDGVARRRTPDASTVGGEGSGMEIEYVAVFST